MENIYHANTKQKKAGVATLISNKADFKVKNVIRDKERHHIMMKKSVLHENQTILNVRAPNNRASKHERQKPIEL